ncbi:copine-8-like [Oscarella lobularis]|uniref:copine-8-like n=1 Tax=Oscarella lobularis TaxID=121494 RepID=UPI00331449E8
MTTAPATQVELRLSCRDLSRTVDHHFSKADTMVVVYSRTEETASYREVWRTEVMENTRNPDFVTTFVMDYIFEERQHLKFTACYVDSTSSPSATDKQDYLGSVECSLGEIVGAPSCTLIRPLTHKGRKEVGKLIVVAEETSGSKDLVLLHFSATKLDKKDLFGKSDPFLVLTRKFDGGNFVPVHRTEVIKNTLNPFWQPFSIPVTALCNGDYHRTIRIECYDWDSDGGHDYIGSFITTLAELKSKQRDSYSCVNEHKRRKKKNYVNSGTVNVLKCVIRERYTFLDFIKGGCQIHFTVAIDFTASNGRPCQPTSLHYVNPYHSNDYILALTAVGEVIQDYDTDKLFPAFGFGAKVPPSTEVSDEFFLNGHATNPYCTGIEGVLDAYHQCVNAVQFFGPTNFAPIINHVARFAEKQKDVNQGYFVLLILTDGVISDMDATKEAIVQASYLPMSIVIIGVGQADFTEMTILDGDFARVESRGRKADRDIVQFVPFRDYVSSKSGRAGRTIKSWQLSRAVLAEIPDQFLNYMDKRGVAPQAPVDSKFQIPKPESSCC